MKEKFKKAVERGDINDVRLFLSNELMLDPRGTSFHEMLSYAENRMDGLFEPDNGRMSEKDSTQWDKDFLFQIKNELDDNFSREKLNYYESVAKQVLKEKAGQLDAEEARRGHQSDNQGSEQQADNWFEGHKKEVYTGVTIGGAVLTTIGLCVSRAALTTLGVVGLAVGGYMLYKESKK